MPRWPSLVTTLLLLASPALAEGVSDDRKAELSYLVRQDCGSCHGMTLRGGLGKPLLPGDLLEWERGELAVVILDGVPGKPMPAWRDLLSEEEALWIADALKKGLIQ